MLYILHVKVARGPDMPHGGWWQLAAAAAGGRGVSIPSGDGQATVHPAPLPRYVHSVIVTAGIRVVDYAFSAAGNEAADASSMEALLGGDGRITVDINEENPERFPYHRYVLWCRSRVSVHLVRSGLRAEPCPILESIHATYAIH